MTLIELLLVIVIIGILAALLLPGIEKARHRAKQASCKSQLRQIGVAFHSYAHDHKDRFPFHVPANEGGTLEWMSAIFTGNNLQLAHLPFQALSNELVDPKLLRCPVDWLRTNALRFHQLANHHVSYNYNFRATLRQPQLLLAADGTIDWSGGRMSNQQLPDGSRHNIVFRHDNRANILFCDGRVEGFTVSGWLEYGRKHGITGSDLWLPGGPPPPGASSSGRSAPTGSGTGAGGIGASASAGSRARDTSRSGPGHGSMSALERTSGAKAESARAREAPPRSQQASTSGSSGRRLPLSDPPAPAVSSPTNGPPSLVSKLPSPDSAQADPNPNPESTAHTDPPEPVPAVAKAKTCWLCWLLPALFAIVIGVLLARALERRQRNSNPLAGEEGVR